MIQKDDWEREIDRLRCYIGNSCYASTNSCVHREPLSLCLAEKSRSLSAGQERLPKLLFARFIISLRLPTLHLCTHAGRSVTFKTLARNTHGWHCVSVKPHLSTLPSFVYIFPEMYWYGNEIIVKKEHSCSDALFSLILCISCFYMSLIWTQACQAYPLVASALQMHYLFCYG